MCLCCTVNTLILYYIPQALTSCPFGQMLQQGVYNFCVNNSDFAHNASYSLLCFKGRVPMAIHLVALYVTISGSVPICMPERRRDNKQHMCFVPCQESFSWMNGSCVIFLQASPPSAPDVTPPQAA